MKQKPMKLGWVVVSRRGKWLRVELERIDAALFMDESRGESVLPVEIREVQLIERPKPAKASKRKSGEPDSICPVCHGTGHPWVDSGSDAPWGYDLRIPCLRCKLPKPRRGKVK